jgi:hypothetical protein
MQSLLELQRGFSAATLSRDPAALASLPIVAGGLDPGTRIAIYRNNVLGNYCKALAATYPVVRRLVGVPFFDAAVGHFVQAHPSTRGDVNRYGGEFAEFLTSHAPARELGYLADVARLEWAIDQTNIAADAAPLGVAALGAVAAHALDALRFRLHPSARLIASPFPIFRIWQVNQPDHEGEERIDLDEGGDTLLVTRGQRGVTIERLGRGDWELLAALAADTTLGVAAEQASAAEPGFDLAEALRRHVAGQTIVAFRAPATPADRGNQ